MNRRAPAVPPLSKRAWERVEARLLERLAGGEHLSRPGSSRPLRHWLHALAALSLAIAAVSWWQREPHLSARRSESLPVAPLPAALPAPRQTSHFVTTSAPTRATLGGATVTLAPRSEMSVVGSDEAGWHVNVERGQVDFDVTPRGDRPPFVVQAGETLVTVIGTVFSVVREGPRARVSVVRGRVQLDSGTHRGSLSAGEHWPDASSSSSVQGSRELTAQSAPAAPSKARTMRARHRASASESFARATRLESTNPDAAIALYSDLARGEGPWAANALYAEARLELERGREATARRRLERYLRRHPAGRNAADVRAILQRVTADGRAR